MLRRLVTFTLLVLASPALGNAIRPIHPPKLHGDESQLHTVLLNMPASQLSLGEGWTRGNTALFVMPWLANREVHGWHTPHYHLNVSDDASRANAWFPEDPKFRDVIRKSTFVLLFEDTDYQHCFVNVFPGSQLEWDGFVDEAFTARERAGIERILCDDAATKMVDAGMTSQDVFEAMSYLRRSRPAEK